MKKQKVNLGKKVFLNKETIVALHSEQQQHMLGGGIDPSATLAGTTCGASCYASCDYTSPTCKNLDSCSICEITKTPTCYVTAFCQGV